MSFFYSDVDIFLLVGRNFGDGRQAVGKSIRFTIHVAVRQHSRRKRMCEEHGEDLPRTCGGTHTPRYKRGLDI